MLKGELTFSSHESVGAHFREFRRQEVLLVTSHKLKNFEGAGSPFFGFGVLIFKGDVCFGHFNNPVGSNGDAEAMLGEVVY